MALTQTQYNNELDSFITNNRAKVGYPGTAYLGECLSLVKRWVDVVAEHVCAPASGNGYGDGYYSIFPLPLNTYFEKKAYTPGHNYNKGSLVIYAATHHIAIWFHDNGNGTHTVFEQNADPDGSAPHTSTRANTRITGILELRVAAPPVSSSLVGKHITLPTDSGTWHLYHENGPYSVAAGQWITTLHPSTSPSGYTYPIVGDKGNGIVVIDSPKWGRGALYTSGSKFVIK